MRRFVIPVVVVLLSLSAFAATKATVDQLKSLLEELHQQNRTDSVTADKLKELTLTEQLTPATLDSLRQYVPGALTTTQLQILSAESALLPPPAAEVPSDAEPSRDTQTAIVNRAIDYVVHQYSQLPRLSAKKTIIRFQNGGASVNGNSGTFSNFAGGNPGNTTASLPYLEPLASYTVNVQSDKGIELPPPAPKKVDPSSRAGQNAQGGGGLVLGLIFMDAAKNDLHFHRWELINGKKVAVFSFTVDKENSHYKVNYCCFPVIENIGGAGSINSSPNMPSMMSQPGGTAATWKPFTATPAYHGDFFIDPDSGNIVRVTTSVEMKPTDIVHQEDTRIDYGAADVAGKQLIVPVRSYTLVELSPNGDAFVKYSTRRTVYDASYAAYTLADVPRSH